MKKNKQRVKAVGAVKRSGGEKVGDGKNRGLKTGLNVAQYWSKLFKENAKARKTDLHLTRAFNAEFPKRGYCQPVGRLRSFFNRGINGYGYGENIRGRETESVPYDSKGKKTTETVWSSGKKPSAKRSKLAKKAAALGWATRRKGRPAKKSVFVSAGQAQKNKAKAASIAKKTAVKVAKKEAARVRKAAGSPKTKPSKKFKFKIGKKVA